MNAVTITALMSELEKIAYTRADAAFYTGGSTLASGALGYRIAKKKNELAEAKGEKPRHSKALHALGYGAAGALAPVLGGVVAKPLVYKHVNLALGSLASGVVGAPVAAGLKLRSLKKKEKTAGLMTNLGTKILTKAKSLPRTALNAAKSLPGHARGSIQNAGSAVSAFSTPVDSFKKGLKMTTKDFGSMSKSQKGLLAVGLAGSTHEAVAKEDPLGKGRGRIERVATSVGDQLGGIIGTPFGITGGVVAGQIGRKAGSLVGRGAEAVQRSFKKPQPAPTP